jgi:hypothetical protein
LKGFNQFIKTFSKDCTMCTILYKDCTMCTIL